MSSPLAIAETEQIATLLAEVRGRTPRASSVSPIPDPPVPLGVATLGALTKTG